MIWALRPPTTFCKPGMNQRNGGTGRGLWRFFGGFMVILWDFMVVLWCEYDDYGGDCVVFYGISQWDCMERKRAKKMT